MIRLNVFLHPCRVPHTDAALCAHVSAQETCTEPLQPDAARTVLKLLLHVVHVDLTVHLHHRHRAAEPETDGRRPRSSELGAEQVGPPSEPKCAAQRDSKAKLTCGTRQVKREGANRGTPWDNRVNSSVRRVGLSEACGLSLFCYVCVSLLWRAPFQWLSSTKRPTCLLFMYDPNIPQPRLNPRM